MPRSLAVVLVVLLAAPIAALPAPAASPGSPVSAAAGPVLSAPFEFLAAGPGGYSAGGYGSAAWIVETNPAYGEGDLYLAWYGGGGMVAVRIAEYTVAQASLPVGLPGGAAVAYASYEGSNRLDVYLAVASEEGGFEACPVAATGDWEEYPALASYGSGLAVLFYNSSDRDYYVAVYSLDCERLAAWRVWDGGLYYRDAWQVASASGDGVALLAFRDYGNGIDVYAALVNESGYTVVQVTSLDGDETLHPRAAYAGGKFLLLYSAANGTLYAALISPGGAVETLTLGPADPGVPAGAAPMPDGSILVYYASGGDAVLVIIDPATASVTGEYKLPAPGALGLEAAPLAGSVIAAFHNATGVYVFLVYEDGVELVCSEAGAGLLGLAWDSSTAAALYARKLSGITSLWALALGGLPEGRVQGYILPADSRSLLAPANPHGLLGLIAGAESSVHAVLAFFENMTVAEALVDARERGVDVAVVTDDDSLEYEAVQYLAAAGVPVYTDAGYENETGYEHTMHEKFIVVDGRHVIVSTANPTTTGLGYNHENVVVVENAGALAAALEAEFADLAGGGYGTRDARLVVGFQALVNESGDLVALTVHAGPEHRLDWELEALAKASAESIDIAEYIFTSSWTIRYLRQAILDAAARGVLVTAVFDHTLNQDTPYRFAYELLAAGVEPTFSRGDAKMHAKTMVFDGAVAATGSFNPTGSAARYNDEVLLVVHGGGLPGRLQEWIRGLYAEWSIPLWSVDYQPLIAALGVHGPQYIAVLNPTPDTLNLSQYLVGDAENLLRDTEGLYRFPEGSTLPPGSLAIVAFNATEFHEYYGVWPDYEIADSTPLVPDMEAYLPGRFQGNFSLDPAGDEAVLAMISPYDPEFLYLIDMVAYGGSTALQGVRLPPAPQPPYTSIARLGGVDAVHHAEHSAPSMAPPTAEAWAYPLDAPASLSAANAVLAVEPVAGGALAYLAATPVPRGSPANTVAAFDIVVRGADARLLVRVPFASSDAKAYYYDPALGWAELPATYRTPYLVEVDLSGANLTGAPVVLAATPSIVGGSLGAPSHGGPGLAPLALLAAGLALAAAGAAWRARRA